jgi:N-acetylmuramoyl-L-alanine amidase
MKQRFFLTAGHNFNPATGKGTGAFGVDGFDEGIETIRFRDALAARLRFHGYEVYTERNNDGLKSVLQWLGSLLRLGDISIDIHFNASTNPAAHGSEVFIPTKSSILEKYYADGIALILGRFFRNRGVKGEHLTARKRIGILNTGTIATNLLIEVCFATNVGDVGVYNDNFDVIVKQLGNKIDKLIKEV